MRKITIIEDYLKVKSQGYIVLNQPAEIMSCLAFFSDAGLAALVIDNQQQINSYILNSTNRYYYAGLDEEGQIATQGLLYENPARGMNFTAINDRYVVIFSDNVSFNDFLNDWPER